MGLIPAHTGKTKATQFSGEIFRAHPRAYGENLQGSRQVVLVQGSSPRIRGKLLLIHHDLSARGLIPAHTGKTFSSIVVSLG